MTKYIWDRSQMKWVEPAERDYSQAPDAPYVWRVPQPYMSPCGTGMIDGRTARREDLKANGCREVDPSEYTARVVNPKYSDNPKFDPDYSKEYYSKRQEAVKGDGINADRTSQHRNPHDGV